MACSFYMFASRAHFLPRRTLGLMASLAVFQHKISRGFDSSFWLSDVVYLWPRQTSAFTHQTWKHNRFLGWLQGREQQKWKHSIPLALSSLKERPILIFARHIIGAHQICISFSCEWMNTIMGWEKINANEISESNYETIYDLWKENISLKHLLRAIKWWCGGSQERFLKNLARVRWEEVNL